jgi:hypothetical protein
MGSEVVNSVCTYIGVCVCVRACARARWFIL